MPTLRYGDAFADWAEAMEREAYSHLEWLTQGSPAEIRRTLRFAAGRSHPFAPHAQRREAWVVALGHLGLTGDVSGIIRSVRTATVKAALEVGWEPSVPKPAFWAGLPNGVVEIPLA